jgi:23S rRNA (cytidine1920-2'-O)/16S rRNA (cytidine1409-2'-O)-methyltransferase
LKPPRGDKRRLDQLLLDRGLAASRERAQALILAGRVEVEGSRAVKAGERVDPGSRLVVLGPDHPFVGRGGVKLADALRHLGVDPSGRVALDVGASTGGFTDCLLQRGALRVYALDVGTGQIHSRLRGDPRVTILESMNARFLKESDLPEKVTLITVDVSFISLRLVLPPLVPLLAPDSDLMALVKPQFEVGRKEVGKKGIVRDARLHRRVIGEILSAGAASGLAAAGLCASSLPGAEGNREYFIHFRNGGTGLEASRLERLLDETVVS